MDLGQIFECFALVEEECSGVVGELGNGDDGGGVGVLN